MSMKLLYLNCKRCGHTWPPRKNKKPKNCPRCNSPYWDTQRRAVNKGAPGTPEKPEAK